MVGWSYRYLGDGYGDAVGDAEVGEVVQEPAVPVLHVALHQLHKRLDLVRFDMLLQKFPGICLFVRPRVL
jgi:hypothetical protein